MPGLFVTATDTGVGKTFLTLEIAKHLQSQGLDVGVMKPISCGPRTDNDALLLKKSLQLTDPLELINPIHLKFSLAPYPASQLERKKFDLKQVFAAYRQLKKRHDWLLVEGIGGVLVPISKKYFVANLIKDLDLPTIIVARAGLGTINHTLLTIAALRLYHISIIGVVLNGYRGKDLSEKSNAQVIEELGHVPVLANIPYFS